MQYWKNPGVFAGAGLEPSHIGLDRFLGVLSVIVQASFSFQGMEIVAMYVPPSAKGYARR
jgi:amino acid transporter